MAAGPRGPGTIPPLPRSAWWRSARPWVCTDRSSFPSERGVTTPPRLTSKIGGSHRDELTVFSGLSHPDVDGGHGHMEASFLTAAPHPERSSFKNTISLDQ